MLRSAFGAGVGVWVIAVAAATSQPVLSSPPDAKGSTPPIEIAPPTQHTQDVNSLVFSDDDENRFVASSGDDGVIKLWDVTTGRLIRNVVRIDPNNKFWWVTSLSRDGRRLLANVGSEFKVWDTITGKEIMSISDPRDRDSVVMSRDGFRIAALRADKTLKLFAAHSGKELSAFRNVVEFSVSPDGRHLASVNADKAIELWDIESGKRNGNAATLDEPVDSVGFSRNGRRIAFKSASGKLTLWDGENNRSLVEWPGSKESDFVFSPDSRYWAAQDGQGEVRIFDAETGAAHSSFKQPAEKSSMHGFSHDGSRIFFTPSDSSARKAADWVLRSVSSSTGQTVNVASGSPNEVSAFGSHLYIEGDGATLRLRDLESWRELRTFVGQSALNGGIFSPTGSRIAVSLPEKVSVLDAETGQRLGACPSSSEPATALAFSSDERKLLYAAGTTIALCDLESRTIVRSYSGQEAAVKSVSLSSDDTRLASGDDDGTVKLWELSTGKLLRTFKGDGGQANVVAFSPDGRKLLAGTGDNKVRIWDLASGRETKTLRMLVGPVTAMAVSPDGRRVAGGPYSQLMVKQWDIETGKELS